jgi:hypothetical protein
MIYSKGCAHLEIANDWLYDCLGPEMFAVTRHSLP